MYSLVKLLSPVSSAVARLTLLPPALSLLHPFPLVPIFMTSSSRDSRRLLHFLGGQMVCNKFNSAGCFSSSCKLLHACSHCGQAHSRSGCPLHPPKFGPKRLLSHLSIPVNAPALAADLSLHPDHSFIYYLLDHLIFSFSSGLAVLPASSLSCRNLLSALSEPDVVSSLLAKEVSEGFMIGPFASPPFSTYLGIILSALPLVSTPARNASSSICVPLMAPQNHPSSGVCWEDRFHFAVCLAFGCKSSPKMFDTLAEALCWFLLSVCRLPHVLYLLDDFLMVVSPFLPICVWPLHPLLCISASLCPPLSQEVSGSIYVSRVPWHSARFSLVPGFPSTR